MLACRSPENPKKLIVKRLLALEGDWVAVPGEVDIHKIPTVHSPLQNWFQNDLGGKQAHNPCFRRGTAG